MDWLDAAMVAILVGFPICYLVAQILALVRWRGWIRAGALIPPFGWTVWAAVFLTDLAWDSTSHNLFPFEILIGAVASLIFLALLKVAALMVRA